MAMIGPGSEKNLDMYCRGMIFGLHGSTMLVKMANHILKGQSFEEFRKQTALKASSAAKTKGNKSKSTGDSMDLIKVMTKKFAELATNISKSMEEGELKTPEL